MNTNKHARNFMLVDAGIQDLAQPDEPPANLNNSSDIPDLVNDDDDDLPEPIIEFSNSDCDDSCKSDCDNSCNSNDDDDDDDDLPELIDISTDTFDIEYIPLDKSTRELANTSDDIMYSISQFFDNHPFAYHLLHIIGFFGLIFIKSNQDNSTLDNSK